MQEVLGSIPANQLVVGTCYIEFNFSSYYWTSPFIGVENDLPEFGDENGTTIVSPNNFFWFTAENLISRGLAHRIPIKSEIISIQNAIMSNKIYILDPNYTDPIDLDYFEDNEEIVVIIENNTDFIFRRSTLEKWFNTNNIYKNPLTNNIILKLSSIIRYTVIILVC
jgi:hypothetical protein